MVLLIYRTSGIYYSVRLTTIDQLLDYLVIKWYYNRIRTVKTRLSFVTQVA